MKPTGGGEEKTTVYYRVTKLPAGLAYMLVFSVVSFENEERDTLYEIFGTLTWDDINFAPNDVLKKEGNIKQTGLRNEVRIEPTKLKSGTVTVTIADKGNYTFKPRTNEQNPHVITVQ